MQQVDVLAPPGQAPRGAPYAALLLGAWLILVLPLEAFGGPLGAAGLVGVSLLTVAGTTAWRRRRSIARRLPTIGGVVLLFITYTRISDVGIAEHGLPSLAQPLILVLGAGTIIRRTRAGGSWGLYAHRRLWTAMTLYAAVLWASAIWASDPSSSTDAATELLKDLVVVYVIVETFDTPRRLRLAVWTVLAAGALLAALSVLQAATHTYGNSYGGLAQAPVRQIAGADNGQRSAGPVGDPNLYGLILVALVPLALARVRDERKGSLRVAAGLSALLLVAGIVLTYSRGDALALAVVAALYVPLARVRPSHVVIVLLALAPATALAPSSFWTRLGSLGDVVSGASVSADASLADRAGAMQVAMAIFEDHPLTGVGAENYGATYVPYALRLNVPSAAPRSHDLYLQVAAETGVPGLLTFGAAMALACLALLRRRAAALATGDRMVDGLATACLLALIAYLVGSAFLPSAYPRYLWVIVGLGMAAACLSAGGANRAAAGAAPMKSRRCGDGRGVSDNSLARNSPGTRRRQAAVLGAPASCRPAPAGWKPALPGVSAPIPHLPRAYDNAQTLAAGAEGVRLSDKEGVR